jgi:hypothetical protein
MEAATMTPAASPVNALCKNALKSFFMNNTPAAPRAVPRKGMKMTLIASPTMSYLPCKNKFRTQKTIHLLLSMPLLYENIAKRLAHSKTGTVFRKHDLKKRGTIHISIVPRSLIIQTLP